LGALKAGSEEDRSMDRYMKLFVLMSVIYFVVGSFLGLLMAMNVYTAATKFAHVHLNLLGFMSMMIFGVGYFILPRFNARSLRWPRLVPVHFWLANVSLVSMVIFYTLSSAVFWLSAVMQLHSIALFLVHLAASMFGTPAEAPKREEPRPEIPTVSGGMKVGEIVERWPATVKVLVEGGLEALSDSEHLENVKKLGVTLAMAAKRHSLDERKLLEEIAKAVGGRVADGTATSTPAPGGLIGSESVIGDVLRTHPRTEEVFRRFYGEGCFSCPGQAYESIAQSALMHNVNEQEILKELNKMAKQD
jgi:cytochrome c oxidase cbb3-type subunit 1